MRLRDLPLPRFSFAHLASLNRLALIFALVILTGCQLGFVTDAFAQRKTRSQTANEWAQVKQVLQQPIDVYLVDAEFSLIASELSRITGLDIRCDLLALEDIGWSLDTRVNFIAEQMTLENALNLQLRDYELTWTLLNGTVLITTEEEAEWRLLTLVYPVSHLVSTSLDDDDETHRRYEYLIDIITDTVAVDAWSMVGGPGSIESFPARGALVISQTATIHREVEDLLQQLEALPHIESTGRWSTRRMRGNSDGIQSRQSQRYRR